MGIFDSFFGIDRKKYDLPEPGGISEVVAAAQKEEPKQPAYQVGLTPDGRVTLRVGSSYYDSTLTMTSEGVRHLIRVLEAAIPEYEVEDTVEETKEEH